jgi:DNA-binding IclR family transcriptional regulator
VAPAAGGFGPVRHHAVTPLRIVVLVSCSSACALTHGDTSRDLDEDKKALLAELERVRRTGIATNDEELESALRSIAAPVRSRSGKVVAAVNVAIPWSPAAMSELVSRLGPTVRTTANEIAARVI